MPIYLSKRAHKLNYLIELIVFLPIVAYWWTMDTVGVRSYVPSFSAIASPWSGPTRQGNAQEPVRRWVPPTAQGRLARNILQGRQVDARVCSVQFLDVRNEEIFHVNP